MPERRLILASTSPRRRLLLDDAGVAHLTLHPSVDDAGLRPGRVTPGEWTIALAYLKAAAALERVPPEAGDAIVLGADTVVVKQGRIIGQPRDEREANEIVRTLNNGAHDVVTGVALLGREGRRLFADSAHVTVGNVPDAAIASYLATGDWRGKAGAYNFSERVADGWPLTCDGDPATVMGLPIRVLLRILPELGIVTPTQDATP